MPTIITANPMSVRFDVRPTFDTFLLSDVNGVDGTYTAASIPDAGVIGNYTVIAPDGTYIYNNTSFALPDYSGSVGYTFQEISIPKNANGSYVLGLYTIIQRTQITDGVNPEYELTFTGIYNFQYVRPTISIEQTVDCISPLFTSTDITAYTLSGQTSIDNTRVHSIIYPPGSAGDGSPIVGSGTTLSTSTFYNGPQTTTISSVVLWTFATSSGSVEEFEVRDALSGVKYITVDCAFICSISCCLRSLYNTMQGYRGVNNVKFKEYRDIFEEAMASVELALISISCGRADEVSAILDQIKIIANCTDDCCGEDTPSLVTGLAGSGVITIVTSGGSPVVVESNTVGDTTTYTISLSSAFVALVNDSYNTTITSADTSVTIVATGTNPKNYDLSVTLPSSSPQTFCSFSASITYGTPNAVATAYSVGSVVNGGDSVSVPTITPLNNTASESNLWRVSGFNFGSPLMATKIFVEVLDPSSRFCQVEIVTIDTSSFEFAIINTIGVPPIQPTHGSIGNTGLGANYTFKFLAIR